MYNGAKQNSLFLRTYSNLLMWEDFNKNITFSEQRTIADSVSSALTVTSSLENSHL